MYAKSPFRKESIKKRISEDLPKNLDKMALSLPDGNEGDNSSQSEDDVAPLILDIEKLGRMEKE